MTDTLWSLFYLALVATPFVALGTAVALVWRTLRALIRLRSSGWHRPGGGTSALTAALAVAVAFDAYWWVGAAEGFNLAGDARICANGAPSDQVVTHLTFPISVECVTQRGTSVEEVPGWVNPVVGVGLAIFALAAVEGVLAVRRRRMRAAGSAR